MFWIQSRVDYINNLPQILSKTAQQQQAQPSLQHPSKGLDSSKLEHHLVQQLKGRNQLRKDKHNLKPCSEYHMMCVDFRIAHFYRLLTTRKS